MKRIHLLVALCAVLSLALPCLESSGDTLVLKSGRKISGEIKEGEGGVYHLKISGGSVTFSATQVKEVIRDGKEFKASDIRRAGSGDGEEDPPISPEDLERYRNLIWELDDLNNEDEDSGLSPGRQKLIDKLAEMERKIAPYLAEDFRSGHDESAPYIMLALVEVDEYRARKAARDAITRSKNSTLRMYAAETLGDLEPASDIAILEIAAGDSQGIVRAAAIRALGYSENRSIIEVVIEALNDNVPLVRKSAVVALRSLEPSVLLTTEGEWRNWAAQRSKD